MSRGELELERLTASIGAVVSGVDLRALDDATTSAIHAALLEREVLFIRDTGLTDDEHMALAARFGRPSVFPMMKVQGATVPTFQVIEDGPDSPPEADYWHTDVTWSAEPPKMAFLRATHVPEYGGDTLWGSMTAAYAALSPAMQAVLGGLAVHHDNESFIAGTVRKLGAEKVAEMGLAERLRREYPGVDHPMIRTHPETGKRAILFGGHFMRHVVGMTPTESDAILGFVGRHIEQPRFHCRWSWRPGDLAIWDERSTVHRAVSDHYPQRREVRRCVVDGDRPYFDPSAPNPLG